MHHKNKLPILHGILTAVLVILFFLFGFLSITTWLFHQIVLSPVFYTEKCIDDTYAEAFKEQVDKRLTLDCGVYDFPYEVLQDVISPSSLQQEVQNYTGAVFNYLCEKTDLPDETYPTEKILEALEVYSDTLPSTDVFASEKNRSILAEKIADRITDMIHVMDHQSLLNKISDLIFNHPVILKLTKAAPVFLAITAICAALILLCGAGIWQYRLHTVSSAFWFLSVIWFAPMHIVVRHNLPARIALAASPLKLYVTTILSTMIQTLYQATIFLLIAGTIVLIISVYFVANARIQSREVSQSTETQPLLAPESNASEPEPTVERKPEEQNQIENSENQ